MATNFFTVSQLKTWIASIPAGANSWEIGFPDDALPVVQNRTNNANGTFYTVRAYLHPDTRTYEVVP